MPGDKKTVAIAIARMGSSRVPGKVMRELRGQPVLRWVLHALYMARGIDEIVLATTTDPKDDVIADYVKDIDRPWPYGHSVKLFRGSETDVLDRFYQAAKTHRADYVVRVTCDCPFLDPDVISEVIKLRELRNVDYASNVDPPGYPDGLDVECFSFRSLESAASEATRPTDRDCVTQYIARNRHRFPAANLRCSLPGLQTERWVLDTEDDWKFCEELCKYTIPSASYVAILDILNQHPEIRELNNADRGAKRNERFYQALAVEDLPQRHFPVSANLQNKALELIPFGAQTFSKSHLQFPGHSPFFVSHADAARIFDVDGHDYVDLVGALLPVILGYRDPDVDNAVRDQLDRGISFSLATELEYQLSRRLCRLIPCAEMVKLGKTGTDVTTAAVRLARAYTGRDPILVGGYHGWADWSCVDSQRGKGIPVELADISWHLKPQDCNDYAFTLYKKKGVAAVIVEPEDNPDYLKFVLEWCNGNGSLLIFDEIITGFRFGLGGAQELYGVTPDLACFGKSMANGMPISALVGSREIMRLMAPPDNIFYSGTFFGECLSIAAAIATIDKLEQLDVAGHILKTGIGIEREIIRLKQKHDIRQAIELYGYYPLLRLKFADDRIRTLFSQEMAQAGVLIIASNNLSFAHKAPELQRIVTAYDHTFGVIADAIKHNKLEQLVPQPIATAPVRAVP
jgi:glutamate-1-semialdehyde 2,1-aminomutase/spore coat polysaccharide biosynthesis protein SpsF